MSLGWRRLRDDDELSPGDTVRLSDEYGASVLVISSVTTNRLYWLCPKGREVPLMLVRRKALAAVRR